MAEPTDFNLLSQNALKQIRALARGNGADADAIQIREMDGDIIRCEAITHLELHPETTEEQKKGRAEIGEVLGDAGAVQKSVQSYVSDSVKNGEVRKLMANMLLERPDKGFSIHAEYFDMPPLKRSYSFHQSCGTCGGQGRTSCDRCNGHRQETCNACHGSGMVACNFCHGSGMRQGPDGKQIQCTHCRATRQISCHTCNRKGRITCRACKGTGDIGCNNCKGLGAFTQITHVDLKMKTLFEIDRSALPHPAVKAIENKGGQMITRQHIHVSGEQVKREDGGLAIQYQVKFPYAFILMSINGKPIKIELFGLKGKILKAPAFVETMIGTQVALLEQSARGQGNVQSNIIKASKTRLLGEALSYVLTMPQKKAFLALKKKYPIGVSNEGLKSIIKTSKKALAQLTTSARYTGYALAGLFNLGLNGAYFMGGIRDFILPIAGQNGTMLLDFALIPLGGFIGSLITKFITQRPLQKALGHLIKNFKRHQMSMLPNYGLSLGIFILIILIIKFGDFAAPSWLP
jgi:hypothetical protein